MIKFKTKTKTIPNARTQEEHFVMMEILEVKYFPSSRYEVKAQYSYGDVLEPPIRITFSKIEVAALEEAVGGLEGNNFNETFDDLLYKVSFYEFENNHTYGLSASDWEVYVEEDILE